MSALLKALSERAMTVQVAGEDVHLRPPSLSMQLAIQRFLKSEDDDRAYAYLRLTAEALHATVVSDQDMSLEDYERIVCTPADSAPDGIQDLVNAALRLCGMNTEVPEGAEDHVAEADAALGNSPTK